MNTRKCLFLFAIVAGFLLTGTRGHASHVDFKTEAVNLAEVSTAMVQPAGSTLFSLEFYGGGHYGHGYSFGYHRHYPRRPYPNRHHYKHRHDGHGYYNHRYPYRYRYRHRPYYHGYRYRKPYYRYRHYW